MARKKGFFGSRAFKNGMNFVYGFGASIVILGALFKIEHYPGASLMLLVGMSVEAFVFFISAFDFPDDEYEWERVYPQLADESLVPDDAGFDQGRLMSGMQGLDAGVFETLSGTLTGLNDNVTKLSGVADAASATNDYTEKIQAAAGKINSLNQSYEVAVSSMTEFAGAASDAKAYHEQVQAITKNLRSLNSIYELELQDAQTHLKSLNQFYGAMTEAMGSMAQAKDDAESYRQGMNDLNVNLRKLNGVYGNMLSAMAGGAQ
jgi:gliding motility-associated protein GldL